MASKAKKKVSSSSSKSSKSSSKYGKPKKKPILRSKIRKASKLKKTAMKKKPAIKRKKSPVSLAKRKKTAKRAVKPAPKSQKIKPKKPKKAGMPDLINSEEDIDLILGLPVETLEEKEVPMRRPRRGVMGDRSMGLVQEELDIKRSHLLAEIRKQSSDEEHWGKARDKIKKELESLLAKKIAFKDEILRYKDNNAELLRSIKEKNKKLAMDYDEIEKRKATVQGMLINLENERAEAEAKRKEFEEKERAWNQREQNLEKISKITENREKSVSKKEAELNEGENLLNSKIAEIEKKKEHLAELMNFKKNLEKKEKQLENDVARLREKDDAYQKLKDDLNQEKENFTSMKEDFLAKEKLFIKKEQIFVAKNKELADKTRDIEKKEEMLEEQIASMEEKKEELEGKMGEIAVKASMLRAETKEKRKDITKLDKSWINQNKELDIRKSQIKNSIALLDKKINDILLVKKQNSKIFNDIKLKEKNAQKYNPTIKILTEKYNLLKETEENLKAEKQKIIKMRDDMIESRMLLKSEEKNILAKVDRLEKDERLLKKREEEVVNKVKEIEDNGDILKQEEIKAVSKLKEISRREKAVKESEKNIVKAKRILDIDLKNNSRNLFNLKKEWASNDDSLKKLGSKVEAEKVIVKDIFEMKDDITTLNEKETEIRKLIKEMENSQSILNKDKSNLMKTKQNLSSKIMKAEQNLKGRLSKMMVKSHAKMDKVNAQIAAKEHKANIYEASVKEREALAIVKEKEALREAKLNMKLSNKIVSSKNLIKKLPRLRRDYKKIKDSYEKEAAKLEKVTMESVAKREMLKDFEARLKGWEDQLAKKDESLKRREQLLVNMEYNVLKEEDEIDDERIRSYMDTEIGGLQKQVGIDLKEPASVVIAEGEFHSPDMIPKGPESVDVLIKQAQNLVKASAIAEAEKICAEIERISQETELSSEDMKKIEYSLMEINTDIKLARLG